MINVDAHSCYTILPDGKKYDNIRTYIYKVQDNLLRNRRIRKPG